MDVIIFQQINELAGKYFWLDTLGIFFAEYFGYVLISGLVIFLVYNFKRYWKMVILGLGSGILARYGFTELIRFFWNRPRPFVENHVNLLLNNLNQPAFPSGHAAFFFALSAIIFLYNKKAGLLFLFASILICLSRIFCGIHWPSDILAGALVGIFSAWVNR